MNNLLDALGVIGTQLQNPLAKLQYVLADDDDDDGVPDWLEGCEVDDDGVVRVVDDVFDLSSYLKGLSG